MSFKMVSMRLRPAARLLPVVLLLGSFSLVACGGGDKKPSAPTTPGAFTDTGPAGAFKPVTGQPSELIARFAIGGQPCGLEMIGDDLWVTDAQNAKLIRINTETQKITGKFDVDDKPCELMEARGTLWVVTQSGVIDRVDPETGKVHARIKTGEVSYEALEAFGSVWVTNRESRTLTRIDPASNKVIETVSLPEIRPGGIVSAGGSLWIGNDTAGQQFLNRYYPDTKKVETVAAGFRPAWLATTAGSVWAAAQGDGTVVRLDARSGAIKGIIKAGQNPVNLDAFDGGSPEIWVPDDVGNLFTRIDGGNGHPIERIKVGKGPAVALVTTTVVWVTNFGDGSVWGFLPGARQ